MSRRGVLAAVGASLAALTGCTARTKQTSRGVDAWGPSLTADGRTLWTPGTDGLCAWDAASGGVRTITPAPGWMRTAAVSPDGREVAVATRNARVRWIDPADGRTLRETQDGHELAKILDGPRGITRLAWSPDGRFVASAALDDTVRVWTPAGQPVAELPVPTGASAALAFNRDGTRLAATSTRGVAMLWDAATWKPVRRLSESTGQGFGLAFSPDGSTLMVASVGDPEDGGLGGDRIHAFDGGSGAHRQSLDASAHSLAFSPDGSLIAYSTPAGRLITVSRPDGTQSRVLRGHADRPYGVLFGRDGTLYSASGSEGVLQWDAAKATLRRRFDLP